MFKPKDIWVWVLCCHEPRELGNGSMGGPNGLGFGSLCGRLQEYLFWVWHLRLDPR
ncbi:hypothetical protein NC651_013783 [Populus alba x Populus x berolinensis]|nr:hypothetical protein NC651_013783 [Populus alba x Populus x berolinensis]